MNFRAIGSNELTRLNISNTFSLLEISDRSFIPQHQSGSEEAELTLTHYQIFGLLCHSIRVEERHGNIPYEEPENLRIPSARRVFNDTRVTIAISSFLQERLLKRFDNPVYLSMSDQKDRLHNPNNFFAPIVPINSYWLTGFLEYKVIVKENMPAPYDTRCMHHADGDGIVSSNDCFHSCYSTRIIDKYGRFPFDSPRLLNAWNASFEFPSLARTDSLTGEEDEKRECANRCGNDCLQVNYYMRQLTMFQRSKLRTFVISGPDEENLITHSASISFWDLLSVVLNGASFYFSFCPATLLLSHWFWSRVTPVRVAPKHKREETEMHQMPVVSI